MQKDIKVDGKNSSSMKEEKGAHSPKECGLGKKVRFIRVERLIEGPCQSE